MADLYSALRHFFKKSLELRCNINLDFGLSGVRALPVAAGLNVVAIVLGLQNFAWAPN